MRQAILKPIALLILLVQSVSSMAQCNDQLLAQASEKLEGCVYVKDYKLKLKEAKRKKDPREYKYTVILNKGVTYRFVLESAKEYPGKLVFNLYAQQGLVASNYNSETGKSYPVVQFQCKKTGVHYISLGFGGKEGCGAMVMAFKEKKGNLTEYLTR